MKKVMKHLYIFSGQLKMRCQTKESCQACTTNNSTIIADYLNLDLTLGVLKDNFEY